MEKRELFREKSLKKAAAPEQLDANIRVTGFTPWLIVGAAALLLLALLVWGALFNVPDTVSGAAVSMNGALSIYVRDEDADALRNGATFRIDGQDYTFYVLNDRIYIASDMDADLRSVLPPSDHYRSAQLPTDLPEGIYRVTLQLGSIRLISLLIGGE